MSVLLNVFKQRISNLSGARHKGEKQFGIENVRRLTLQDVPKIIYLQNEFTLALFGDADVYETVYNSVLTLGLMNEEKLIGVVCLGDAPTIKAVPMWSWEGWLRNLFGLDLITTFNTKWIKLLAFDVGYMNTFLLPILKFVFIDKSDCLEYIAMSIPPGVDLTNNFPEYMSRIFPRGFSSAAAVTTIGLFSRINFIKPYKIRYAVEEDNDDLVAIIDQNAKALKETYGEFYIAEMVRTKKSSKRKIIVADYKGYAVGVIIINSEVNYDTLNEAFEVFPYHSFKTAHDLDDLANEAEAVTRTVDVTPADSVTDIYSLQNSSNNRYSLTFDERSEDVTIPSYYSMSETFSDEDNWTIDPSLEMSALLLRRDENFFDIPISLELSNTGSMLSVMMLMNTEDDFASSLHRLLRDSSTDMRTTKQALEFMKKMVMIPNFFGNPSAFALEVIASEPDHAPALRPLIEAAFQCLENRDYCILCSPSTEPHSEMFKDFVRMTPRDHSIFPHDLYILHRNTLHADMKVRLANKDDDQYVLEFLNQMLKPTGIHEQYIESVQNSNSNYITFIMTCYNQIIGIAVVNELVDLDYLIAHYTLYKWIDEQKHSKDDVGALESFLIYPIFQKFCRFFLNQIHRLADLSLLVSAITYEDMDQQSKKRPLINCIQYLVPVNPRHIPQYDAKYLEENFFPPSFVTEERQAFAVYLSTPMLTGIKRIEISTRIVVVGTGDTAMAFLETLVCGSGPEMLVTFNNITVVSPHGLPSYRETPKFKNMFTITRGQTLYHKILQMNLRINVNIVYGVLSKIKRDRKIIIVNDYTQVPYDVLVLFCGEQYMLPKIKQKRKKSTLEYPENAFVINTDSDAFHVLNKLNKYKRELTDKRCMEDDFVIVYGNDIRAIACLASLIELGIPPQHLALIAPTSSQLISSEDHSYSSVIFNDPLIADAVYYLIVSSGINLLKDFSITDWHTNDDNWVDSVTVLSKISTKRIGCKFIFIYSEKMISYRTHQAISKAGLVFDGRLVIDAKFCTNDPSIFAAGPLTKYSRKYQAEYKNHVHFNAQEVGERIGQQFRDTLIPESYKNYEKRTVCAGVPDEFPNVQRGRCGELPNFKRPKIVSCVFPGDVFYLSVSAPGRSLPIELIMGEDDYGRLLQTGDYEQLDRQGYFRIHLDCFDVVQSFSCLSKEPIDINNLIRIQGKHAALLNDLVVRFDDAMIEDLFEFFKEPVFTGIFYDQFPKLMENVRQVFLEYEMDNGETLPQIILRLCKEHNDWETLTEAQNAEIEQILQETNAVAEVEDKVLEYIQNHKIHLPMYAYPCLVRKILANHNRRSPMFTKGEHY